MSSHEIASGITRRDFLQLLGVIGVAVALPVPLDLASDEQVAAARLGLPFRFRKEAV